MIPSWPSPHIDLIEGRNSASARFSLTSFHDRKLGLEPNAGYAGKNWPTTTTANSSCSSLKQMGNRPIDESWLRERDLTGPTTRHSQ